MVNVDIIANPEHTLKQSGISEGVKIVINEKLIAQPVPVPIVDKLILVKGRVLLED